MVQELKVMKDCSSDSQSDSESDSESDSSVELTGGMVSRRGRPRDRGVARMYSKGRRWQ